MKRLAMVAICVWLGVGVCRVLAAAGQPPADSLAPDPQRLGISAGLCIQLGCDDTLLAARLARTGRFLVQLLDGDAGAVDRARQSLASQPWYGLVSVARLNAADRLPFAENLVNVAVVRRGASARVGMDEVARVLCPGGIVLVHRDALGETALRAAGFEEVEDHAAGEGWRAGRKPWPAGMDQWTHPCGAADGNTVSHDMLVGPPRRVRWIAGPAEEISSMVSAGGRNFYGGVWARDAFNGLPLWQQDVRPSPAQGGFSFRYTSGSVRPIAVGKVLFVSNDNTVCALDGASGVKLRAYPEAGRPTALLHVRGKLLAVGPAGVRALEVESGRLAWKYAAAVEPRFTVATDRSVVFLEGNPRHGEPLRAVCLELASGKVAWQRTDYPWAALVRRIVAHDDLAVFEVSTLADKREGNAIHVASMVDGKILWNRQYVPGMTHWKQSRAMFIGDTLWILEHLQYVGLDPHSGQVRQKYPAGLCHCFPPVATSRFMFSGEMNLTDLATGTIDAQHITKASCGRDGGWVPANGLIYTGPKHCVCWPMLRGYTALAPGLDKSAADDVVKNRRFVLEKGCDPPATLAAAETDWPCYRHDAWRSGAAAAGVPAVLKPLWSVSLGEMPQGTIAKDWRENPFVHGPITAPVAAGGLAFAARPDAHQVVAVELKTGQVRWRTTVEGRVDTPPTIHGGLCLFGTRSGWVYCLRADDGRMVWRLRAAPTEEQIVAYGQIESPWPVPGSVLIVDGVAYFAAGRHPLADGGILLFAAEPATGRLRWVKRLDTLPMTDFYGCIAWEFDNFDLLHREDDGVAMSRWLLDRKTGRMIVKPAETFARLKTGAGPGVVVQRGLWSYAPRQQPRFDAAELWPRPLAVFRDNTLVGCLPDRRTLFRRDFDGEVLRQFDMTWLDIFTAGDHFQKKKGDVWPVDRLAENARWSSPLLPDADAGRIAALALAGRQLLAAGSQGGLQLISLDDGRPVARADLAPPLWDGIAVVSPDVLVSTADGRLVCLGQPR
jgi:outer membrane protein assembly factor BamB